MSAGMLVSVVIPCRERLGELMRAVASVVAAAGELPSGSCEIIVVDDGSTLPLEAAFPVDMAAGLPLLFKRHTESRGAAAARNAGVAAARGRYVAFLDSDDEYERHHLARSLALLESADVNRGICLSAVLRVGAGKVRKVVPKHQPRRGETLGDWLWLRDGFVQTSTFVVSRALATEVPFEVGRKTQEDLFWLLTLERIGAFFHWCPEVGAVWHDDARPDRLSLGHRAKMWDVFVRSLPQGYLSPRAAAACRFGGCFEDVVKSRNILAISKAVARCGRDAGWIWMLRFILRRSLGRVLRVWFG